MNDTPSTGVEFAAETSSFGLTIETLCTIVGHSPVGVCVSDCDGVVEIANTAFLALCDHPEGGVLGKHITRALPAGRRLQVRDQSDAGLRSSPAERIIADKDGQERSILASAIHIRDQHGQPKILTYAFDVTEHRMLERQLRQKAELLEQLSTQDRLTGLFNRRHGEVVLDVEVGRSGRSDKPLSIARVDVDRFERFGQDASDTVLVGVATCLKAVIRGTDTLARCGSEQFLMILPFTASALAIGPLRRARAELPAECGPHDVTFSAGVTEYRSGETAQEFLARADRLLARAKAEGEDRILHSSLFDEPV